MHIVPQIKEIERKHLMAIDYGRKFTGVSLYKYNIDPFPLAHGRIPYENDKQLIEEISKTIEEEFVDILIMGIPYFTDGTESKLTKELLLFAKLLRDNISAPVFTIDETLTTYEAEQRMMNDPRYDFKVDLKRIDAVCATIIMEEFIKNTENKNG
jgi:putative Holliday junction resolvase